MERAHRELGARLADRLSGDDAHRLTDLDDLAGGKVAAVARAADALAGLAHEHGTHLDWDARADDLPRGIVGYRRARGNQDLAIHGDVLRGDTPRDFLEDRLGLRPLPCDVADPDAVGGAAIFNSNHDVLPHVDESTRQVDGV